MNFLTRMRDRRRAITRIEDTLSALMQKVDHLMTVETDLQTDLDAIKTGVATLADKFTEQAKTIGDLRAQLAAGTPVSQEQLDQLHAEAQGIVASLSGLTTPATPPA